MSSRLSVRLCTKSTLEMILEATFRRLLIYPQGREEASLKKCCMTGTTFRLIKTFILW